MDDCGHRNGIHEAGHAGSESGQGELMARHARKVERRCDPTPDTALWTLVGVLVVGAAFLVFNPVAPASVRALATLIGG
jgi:hypothetical protein